MGKVDLFIITISFDPRSPFFSFCLVLSDTGSVLSSTESPEKAQVKADWTVSVPVAQTTQQVRVRSITASYTAKQFESQCLCEEGSVDPVVCAVKSVLSSLY